MNRNVILALGASVLAMAAAAPASAQTIPEPEGAEQTGDITTGAGADQAGDAPSGTTDSAESGADADIIVTAQRRAESLQNVPIAVSAFSGEALERQQIENASDLQQSLPNVTFTKTNFTSSSFTIRGVGDLCTGFSCDSATGIHVNDMPLTSTRLFETEYFDLERVEVLRGPQGTLYGRNATSGVVNFITARPNLNELQASLSAEYGNFDSIKLTGMVNVPIGGIAGVRLAGYWLNRDGYIRN
ncbi:MAG TPA: TonB-dependent receptor, partial [Allosphingosinicella sp.]